jgi:hypothetical protein
MLMGRTTKLPSERTSPSGTSPAEILDKGMEPFGHHRHLQAGYGGRNAVELARVGRIEPLPGTVLCCFDR